MKVNCSELKHAKRVAKSYRDEWEASDKTEAALAELVRRAEAEVDRLKGEQLKDIT